MSGYSPLKITGMSQGLIQNRENFLLPNDAYPTLNNAYVWRERIKRKKGCQLLGRLQRNFSNISIGPSLATTWSFNIYSKASISQEPNAQIAPRTLQIYFTPTTATGNIVTPGYTVASDCQVYTNTTAGLYSGAPVTISGVSVKPGTGPNLINGGPYNDMELISGTSFKLGTSSIGWGQWLSGGTWSLNTGSTAVLIDQGDGTITSTTSGYSGTINYTTGDVVLTVPGGSSGSTVNMNFGYYPCLPVMGIRTRELQSSQVDQTIVFDQKYAYFFNEAIHQYQEFIPGTTWNAEGASELATDFFWSTNYWISDVVNFPMSAVGSKLFWVTNNTGSYFASADPPRITDGKTWINFFPSTWSQIDATNYLTNFLCMLPFRGRMVVFNTYEGTNASASINYSNRIRWSTIGNPFIAYHNTTGPNDPNTGSWRDDIRGQGGFLDIPTSEDIISVGFVRDNLIIFCERSTWQLRYTGRSIAPFNIEKVNSELGAEGTFSSVQFDTSLLGIGDKGIVECDSYQSNRIDVKIPDFVFQFQAENDGPVRVHGIRDFELRLAYWTVPLAITQSNSGNVIYPNTRLVYNYENDSWALFNDSLTTLGTYQRQDSQTWLNTQIPWIECNFSWTTNVYGSPYIIGGNQQGFVEYLDELTTNDVSLFISDITANTNTATVVTSPNHNMQTGFVIGIRGISALDPFANLNGGIFGIQVIDYNTFSLYKFNSADQQFSDPQLDVPNGSYNGNGLINIRENFSIVSKKFNFLDEGQNIQLGYLDILMSATEPDNPGAISLNVYLDYDDVNASNTLPQNQINNGNIPVISDLFFNTVIPTTKPALSNIKGTKFWQRVFCATRANFITIQYTFSNAQMAGIEQQQDVQIDAQVLWIRRGGRMSSI